MPALYALLVAINAYPPPVDSLDGCINDADSVEAMLRARFDEESLHLLRIQDSAATRQAVIDGFRSHLGQAKECDLALFFFAGHGSRVPTGGHFSTVEPSGLNSSIVCYDSRLPNGLDLVDKDMAALISEVTANGAHLTTIFDRSYFGYFIPRSSSVLATIDPITRSRCHFLLAGTMYHGAHGCEVFEMASS